MMPRQVLPYIPIDQLTSGSFCNERLQNKCSKTIKERQFVYLSLVIDMMIMTKNAFLTVTFISSCSGNWPDRSSAKCDARRAGIFCMTPAVQMLRNASRGRGKVKASANGPWRKNDDPGWLQIFAMNFMIVRNLGFQGKNFLPHSKKLRLHFPAVTWGVYGNWGLNFLGGGVLSYVFWRWWSSVGSLESSWI